MHKGYPVLGEWEVFLEELSAKIEEEEVMEEVTWEKMEGERTLHMKERGHAQN